MSDNDNGIIMVSVILGVNKIRIPADILSGLLLEDSNFAPYIQISTDTPNITLLQNTTVTGYIDMNDNRIIGLSDPILINDGVNKIYSDTATLANAADIATNVVDIATNATDIATNVVDIATNATDIATNVVDIATVNTNLSNHVSLVSSWKEYSSTIVSNEILRSPVANSTVIQNSVDTTSVIVDNGDYRATFHAQFDILDGLCECASDLLALVDDLETNTFTVHGAAYGYSDVISPGLYSCAGATTHTGTLYIDADGDPDAVFVFLAAGAHAIAASASTILLNNAQACNIFWVVVGALSIGAGCTLRGTYIGKAAVAAGALFVLEGRLFTTGGAIALAAVTADVPLGVSQYNFRSLASYLFYSVAGAISTPSYTSTSGVTWSISTSLGIVSGFGAPHDGTFPISMSPHVKISFGIYKGDTLVPVSLVYVETDALGSNFHIDTAANITVDTNEDKTITARVDILSDMGGVIVGNRTLFLMPLV